jgi:hypothetical protein
VTAAVGTEAKQDRAVSAAGMASIAAPLGWALFGWAFGGDAEQSPAVPDGIWVAVGEFVILFVNFMALGVGVAFFHILLIGAPLYALLSRRICVRWWMCAAAGAVIGGVPIPTMLALSFSGLAGWPPIGFAAPFAWAGSVGGAVFGLMVAPRKRAEDRQSGECNERGEQRIDLIGGVVVAKTDADETA